MKIKGFLLGGLLMIAGCAPVNTASTYQEAQMGRAATVMKGEVLALRGVTIQGTSSGVGAVGGAAAGGAAGSNIGGSTAANVVGAVGGAIVGGIVGAIAEEQLRQGGAVELIVRQDNTQVIAVTQTNEEGLKVGDRVLILRSDRVRVILDKTQ